MSQDSNTRDNPFETSSPPPPNYPPPILAPPIPARPQNNAQDISDEPSTSSIPNCVIEPDENLDNDEEISQQMTASYSEISFKSENSPEVDRELASSLLDQLESLATNDTKRPVTLLYRENETGLKGTVLKEGDMTHFVADDLEFKIKLSSPISKLNESQTLMFDVESQNIKRLDSSFLNELESEAQRIATSVDSLTESLSEILHSISSMTADNVEVYKDAVSKMSDSMDANIKSMYTLLAKTEEISDAMKVVHAHSARMKEIRKLVDLLETFL